MALCNFSTLLQKNTFSEIVLTTKKRRWTVGSRAERDLVARGSILGQCLCDCKPWLFICELLSSLRGIRAMAPNYQEDLNLKAGYNIYRPIMSSTAIYLCFSKTDFQRIWNIIHFIEFEILYILLFKLNNSFTLEK